MWPKDEVSLRYFFHLFTSQMGLHVFYVCFAWKRRLDWVTGKKGYWGVAMDQKIGIA